MMKHTLRIMGASAIALAALLLLAGCSELFNDISRPSANGSVRVQIGPDADGRTLSPGADQFAGYRLDFSLNGILEKTVTLAHGETAADVVLEAGSWTVKATGLILVGNVATDAVYGTETVSVTAGKTSKVNVVLDTSVSGAPGIFKYYLEFPDLDDNDSIRDSYSTAVFTITPAPSPYDNNSGTINFDMREDDDSVHGDYNSSIWQNLIQVQTMDDGGYRIDGELELPPGQYDLEIKLVSNRIINDGASAYPAQAFIREVVYVYSNLVTATPQYKLTERNFTAELYFKGTASILTQPDGRNYAPTTVQVSLGDDYGYVVDTDPVLIPIVQGKLGGGAIVNDEWELYIKAGDINSNHHVGTDDQLYFRFIAEAPNGRKVFSPWSGPVDVTAIQGRDLNIDLSASIYSVDSDPDIINAPAGTTIKTFDYLGDEYADFADDTLVRVELTPPASYGLLEDSFNYGYWDYDSNGDLEEYDMSPAPIYVEHDNETIYFYFIMTSNTLEPYSGTFYQLKGTAEVETTAFTYTYKATSVTAFAYREDSSSNWDWEEIGTAATADDGTWVIPGLPEWFKYSTQYADLKFVFTLETAATVPAGLETLEEEVSLNNHDLTDDSDIEGLFTDPSALLTAPDNLDAQAEGDSIRVSWTAVADAKGYNVYRNNVKLNTSPVTNDYWLDDTAVVGSNTLYAYSVETVNAWELPSQSRNSITGSF